MYAIEVNNDVINLIVVCLTFGNCLLKIVIIVNNPCQKTNTIDVVFKISPKDGMGLGQKRNESNSPSKGIPIILKYISLILNIDSNLHQKKSVKLMASVNRSIYRLKP